MTTTQSFVPAFGNRPSQLVGRDQEIAWFLQGLAGPVGHPGRATLCLGQRGMGKTALLLEFAAQAAQHGFVTAKATAGETMLAELIEGIQLGGTKHLPKAKRLTGASVGVLGFSAGLTFSPEAERTLTFRAKLSLLCQELGEHGIGVLLLVDEVAASSPPIRQLATTYQELVGEGRNVAVALAGLPAAVSSVLNDQVLTFLNRATKVHLGPLPIPAVTAYYAQALAGLGKAVKPAELERAAAATMGYPYLLQLVGYYLLEFAGNQPTIGSDTVELAVTASRQALAEAVFAPALAPLSKRDRAFLQAMAADAAPSAISQVAQRLGVSADSAQQTRRRLIGHGVIAPAGLGEVEFTIPYLAEFLRGKL